VNSKFTLNYGIRLEHETGLAEQDNNFTVGFDRTATSALSSVTIPRRSAGRHCRAFGRRRLDVRGRERQQDHPGNPPKMKASPRVGVVYSLQHRTVLRGGYGVYWAPFNYQAPSTSTSNYGQVGYTQNTSCADRGTPTVTLDNPFPIGVVQPSGNSRGSCPASTATQLRRSGPSAPRVQQWSADLQREIGSGMALTVTYMGARAITWRSAARTKSGQLEPARSEVPGARRGAGASCRTRSSATRTSRRRSPTPATLARSRLLKPFPQFTTSTPGRSPRAEPVQRRHRRVDAAPEPRVGRPYELHLQHPQGQPARRDELLLGRRPARR
jgi:hypothetical protein